MRIFLTGGTGYLGSAVLDALVRGGHRVHALVRNSEKATQVQARGAQPILGNLAQPATYLDAAAAADVAVHTAYENSARGSELDAAVLESLLRLPEKPGRVLIYTSGVWVLGGSTTPMDEGAAVNPAEHVAWRPANGRRVLDAAASGIRTAVIRPGIVYGGSRGIIGGLFRDAANGLVRVIGSGENHWPLVYDRDLGDLYLRIVNHADAAGLYHANDERDERVNDLVAAIVGHVAIRPSIRRVPIEEARKKMGTYAEALALDQIVRSPRARALGWNPSLHSVSGNTARLFEEWRNGREAA
jgi:nucleoside-diphosphate-sugar epimerase